MADAALEQETITTAVVLELTPDEARALHDVLQCIGGKAQTTRRHLMDNIDQAMADTGFVQLYGDQFADDLHGSLYFMED